MRESRAKCEGRVSEIEERERRRFRPFIWVHSKGGTHSGLRAAVERQIKVLWLPEGFESLSNSEKLMVVQDRVRNHYQTTGGKFAGFGEIQEYRYADTLDTSIVFDVAGNVIEEHGGRFLLPEVWWVLQLSTSSIGA